MPKLSQMKTSELQELIDLIPILGYGEMSILEAWMDDTEEDAVTNRLSGWPDGESVVSYFRVEPHV
jgi:hypothetical protein